MLVQSERTLALRCSACGRLQCHPFSLFALSRDRSYPIVCECGFHMALLKRHGRVTHVHLTCVVCEAPHQQHFPSRQLLKNELCALFCPETGVELGYVGEKSSVKAAVVDHDALENLVFDPECRDYFLNPQVMRDTLAAVQAVAEVGRLGCACGDGRIELNIYPEKLELICGSCGSTIVLYAETDDDLSLAVGLRSLTLPALDYGRAATRPSSHHTKG